MVTRGHRHPPLYGVSGGASQQDCPEEDDDDDDDVVTMQAGGAHESEGTQRQATGCL